MSGFEIIGVTLAVIPLVKSVVSRTKTGNLEILNRELRMEEAIFRNTCHSLVEMTATAACSVTIDGLVKGEGLDDEDFKYLLKQRPGGQQADSVLENVKAFHKCRDRFNEIIGHSKNGVTKKVCVHY
jgi:hypothetical protein